MEQTDEELEHYKRLISLSYPQPKKPIAENVMKQIKRETAIRRMNRIIRYGSIAACFVLIASVIIGIIPQINRASKSANAEMCTSDYAAAGSDAFALNVTEVFSNEATVPTDKAKEADQRIFTEDSLASSPEKAEDDMAEAIPEQETPSFLLFSARCDLHPEGMHRFPILLADCVTEEEFNAWYNSPSALDECGTPSVRTFVRFFSIPKDQLTKIGSEAGIDFPIDLIYSEDN